MTIIDNELLNKRLTEPANMVLENFNVPTSLSYACFTSIVPIDPVLVHPHRRYNHLKT
jgi:hypothetical protein